MLYIKAQCDTIIRGQTEDPSLYLLKARVCEDIDVTIDNGCSD